MLIITDKANLQDVKNSIKDHEFVGYNIKQIISLDKVDDENVPDEYYEDIDNLANVLRNLKINDPYDYWEYNNASLNEYWHGVIGIMKDYRVVAFVIRNDGILADERGYENSENKIVRRFNL